MGSTYEVKRCSTKAPEVSPLVEINAFLYYSLN